MGDYKETPSLECLGTGHSNIYSSLRKDARLRGVQETAQRSAVEALSDSA